MKKLYESEYCLQVSVPTVIFLHLIDGLPEEKVAKIKGMCAPILGYAVWTQYDVENAITTYEEAMNVTVSDEERERITRAVFKHTGIEADDFDDTTTHVSDYIEEKVHYFCNREKKALQAERRRLSARLVEIADLLGESP